MEIHPGRPDGKGSRVFPRYGPAHQCARRPVDHPVPLRGRSAHSNLPGKGPGNRGIPGLKAPRARGDHLPHERRPRSLSNPGPLERHGRQRREDPGQVHFHHPYSRPGGPRQVPLRHGGGGAGRLPALEHPVPGRKRPAQHHPAGPKPLPGRQRGQRAPRGNLAPDVPRLRYRAHHQRGAPSQLDGAGIQGTFRQARPELAPAAPGPQGCPEHSHRRDPRSQAERQETAHQLRQFRHGSRV